jgi:hypothetical protein
MIEMPPEPAGDGPPRRDETPEKSSVSDPAKLIRLGTMLQALMAEVREADTDEQSRLLLARIHAETMEELATVLSPDLMEELSEFAACCDDDGVPTESEIRIAQAQLVGWLQGLLQGLQASMMAQQAAAANQLRELSAGKGTPPSRPPGLSEHRGTYL